MKCPLKYTEKQAEEYHRKFGLNLYAVGKKYHLPLDCEEEMK